MCIVTQIVRRLCTAKFRKITSINKISVKLICCVTDTSSCQVDSVLYGSLSQLTDLPGGFLQSAHRTLSFVLWVWEVLSVGRRGPHQRSGVRNFDLHSYTVIKYLRHKRWNLEDC